MSIRVILAALLLFFGFTGHAAAQDVKAVPCNGCSSQQIKSIAKTAGNGDHYYYNLSGGTFVGYYVEKLDTQGNQYIAVPIQPEQWMLDEWAAILVFYRGNGNSLHGPVTASASSVGGGSVNAYDVVGSSQDRNRVSDALANNPRMIFTSVMSSYGRVIRLANVATPDVDLTVTVNFPDGSHAVYKFNWNTKKWEYVADSAVDSHGNSIPETATDFSNNGAGGSFSFTGPGNSNDVNDFISRAHSAGVSITNGIAWVCVGGTSGVHCYPN